VNFRFTFPPRDEFELDNQLDVICVPHHEQNGLVAAVQVPAGRFSDPPGLEGLCELTAGLLSQGTETLPAETFAETCENAGATVFTDVGEEYCVLGMRLRARSAPALVPLLAEMVQRPRLAEEEFLRLRREMVTTLRAEAVDPYLLATRHFYAELAGTDHPAGRLETSRSLKKIRPQETKSFFNNHFSPAGSLCVIAGDLDAAEIKELAAAHFSTWRPSPGKKTAVAPPLPPRPAAVRLIDKPDLTQVFIAAGHACPGERCPEKTALLLANHILGGGNFSSRLTARIRSSAGKTYHVSSQMHTETEFGVLLITTSTQNRKTRDVLDAVIDEYRRFCREGVTAEELAKAKQYAIGNMAFQLEGLGSIVEKLLWLRFYGRPESYIERFEEIISSITLQAVNDAIHRHLSPEKLIIAAAGRRTEIEHQLSPFGAVRCYHFRDKA
jgi:zinc protease